MDRALEVERTMHEVLMCPQRTDTTQPEQESASQRPRTTEEPPHLQIQASLGSSRGWALRRPLPCVCVFLPHQCMVTCTCLTTSVPGHRVLKKAPSESTFPVTSS